MKVLFVGGIEHARELHIEDRDGQLPPYFRFHIEAERAPVMFHAEAWQASAYRSVAYGLRYWRHADGVVVPLYCIDGTNEDHVHDAFNIARRREAQKAEARRWKAAAQAMLDREFAKFAARYCFPRGTPWPRTFRGLRRSRRS